jgi:beta-lactamase superfamily II metal-dependent hydrolase
MIDETMANKKIIAYAAAIISVAAIVSTYIYSASRMPQEFEFFIFDTPGSPSIFIRTPHDARILIDGGSDSEIIRHLTEVLPFYSRHIDDVIVTDEDAAHSVGLIDVIKRYDVSRVMIPSVAPPDAGIASSADPMFQLLVGAIHAHQVPIRLVGKGDRMDDDDALIQALFPVSADSFIYSKASPPSLVLRISYGTTSFFLLGDSSLKTQRFIASSTDVGVFGAQGGYNALVIFHAIAASYLYSGLIDSIRPRLAVYSQSPFKNDSSHASTARSAHSKDPLYSILSDHRFNLKQKSAFEALSDGMKITVI